MTMDGASPATTSATERAPTEPRAPVTIPPAPPAGGRAGWAAASIISLVVGSFLILISIPLLGSGGTVLWAAAARRDAGFYTTDAHGFSTSESALITVPTDLGSGGMGWLYAPGLLGEIRVRVTPESGDPELFVGIGPTAEVERYLDGADRTVIEDFWTDETRHIGGDAPASPPTAQDFWVASDTGPGPRSVVWDPTPGSWTVVVMNADGQPGIDTVGTDLGATVPALPWIGLGLLIAGGVFLIGGILLVAGAFRRRRQANAARTY